MFDLTHPKLGWMTQADDLTLAIQALESVREHAKAGTLPDTMNYRYRNAGICLHWANALDALGITGYRAISWSHDLIEFAAVTWPHSRCPGERYCYPVPHTESRWEGKGLELRLSLIDHTLTLLRATREYVIQTRG